MQRIKKGHEEAYKEFVSALERRRLPLLYKVGISLILLFGIQDIIVIPELLGNSLLVFSFTFFAGLMITLRAYVGGGFGSAYYPGLFLLIVGVGLPLPWMQNELRQIRHCHYIGGPQTQVDTF